MKYPTNEELDILSKWKRNDIHGLIDFLQGLWWMPYDSIIYTEDSKKYYLTLNTHSWKGNEDIIHALMDNIIFWHRHWVKSEKPGLYYFEFNKDESTSDIH